MTQGRAKGSKAEIEIAKLLKGWWSAVEPSEFVRTPLSGGWGGKDLRAGFRASGDIMTTAQKFPFTVEVKRREGWSWKTLLKGKPSPVWGYWDQAIGQAKEMGGIPLLFFRRNREHWNVMLPFKEFLRIEHPFVPDDYVGVWSAYELKPLSVRLHPIVIRASAFFEVDPWFWTTVALTYPRK